MPPRPWCSDRPAWRCRTPVSIYARQELVEFQDVGVGSAAATLVFVRIALMSVIYIIIARLNVAAGERE